MCISKGNGSYTSVLFQMSAAFGRTPKSVSFKDAGAHSCPASGTLIHTSRGTKVTSAHLADSAWRNILFSLLVLLKPILTPVTRCASVPLLPKKDWIVSFEMLSMPARYLGPGI